MQGIGPVLVKLVADFILFLLHWQDSANESPGIPTEPIGGKNGNTYNDNQKRKNRKIG